MADTVTFVIMLIAYSALMIYLGYRGYKATKGITDWLVAIDQSLLVSCTVCCYILLETGNAEGIVASIVGGLAATLLWYTFVYSKTASVITHIK